MNRVALFAHFDGQNEIKPYILYYLERLRAECARIIFVSTSPLGAAEIEKLRPYVESVLLKENVGLDFGMWRHALDRLDLAGCDELVLTNSSLFGPLYPLGPIFRRMADDPCDFWGMTDNFEHRWHLQSYFLVLRRRVLESNALRLFFDSVLPYRSPAQIILSYEVGLTSFLLDSGFSPGAFAPIEAWASWTQRRQMDWRRAWNPTLFHPERLLAHGMPFVKVFLLRDNVTDTPLEPVYRMMKDSGYDLDLVRFDRPPKVGNKISGPTAAALRLWSRFAAYSEGASALPKGRSR